MLEKKHFSSSMAHGPMAHEAVLGTSTFASRSLVGSRDSPGEWNSVVADPGASPSSGGDFLCQGAQYANAIHDHGFIMNVNLMAKVIQKVDRSCRKGWCQSWLRQSWKPSSQTWRRTRRGAQWNQTQLRVESFHRKLRLALSKHEMSLC